VYDEIAFAPRNLGQAERQVETTVKSALGLCDLDYQRLAGRSPFTLSGGEARLIAVAATLATQKKVHIFDEPTVGMDAVNTRKIKELFGKLAGDNTTVIVISHDSDLVYEISDRIYMNLEGRFVTDEKYKLYIHSELFKQAGVDIPSVIKLALQAGQTEKFRSLKINSLDHPICRKAMQNN
jgi:energy-coupling factor transport system ATP-binding protein